MHNTFLVELGQCCSHVCIRGCASLVFKPLGINLKECLVSTGSALVNYA